jgi:hypothetical protein
MPKVKLALSAQSNLVVAIATIYRSTIAGFKGYFSVFATLRALCREHLASGPVAIVPIAIATVSVLPCFPCLTA